MSKQWPQDLHSVLCHCSSPPATRSGYPQALGTWTPKRVPQNQHALTPRGWLAMARGVTALLQVYSGWPGRQHNHERDPRFACQCQSTIHVTEPSPSSWPSPGDPRVAPVAPAPGTQQGWSHDSPETNTLDPHWFPVSSGSMASVRQSPARAILHGCSVALGLGRNPWQWPVEGLEHGEGGLPTTPNCMHWHQSLSNRVSLPLLENTKL